MKKKIKPIKIETIIIKNAANVYNRIYGII